MPELPEVETVRRGLAPVLEGQRLVRVEARRPDLRFPLPDRFAARLMGRQIGVLRRRAKYLIAELDDGERLLMHLGMSGRFSVQGRAVGQFHHGMPGSEGGLGLHDHIVLETESGTRIVYSDHRRFGMMDLYREDTGHRLLDALGPEPLTRAFNARALAQAFKAKRAPVKAALLDQTLVAGLGNIYVCEALHRARISPERICAAITPPELQRLVKEIKVVLAEAIAAGGSTLRDYRSADGNLGYFQHSFRVYDRAGEPCSHRGCTGTLVRTVQSGRSSYHCPECQR